MWPQFKSKLESEMKVGPFREGVLSKQAAQLNALSRPAWSSRTVCGYILVCLLCLLLFGVRMTAEAAGIFMKEEITLPPVGKSLPVPNLLNTTNILAALGSFLFWVDFYLLALILNPKRSSEWNCRIVTFVHGGVSAFLSLLVCFYIGPWPFNYIAQPCNDTHLAIVLFSFGYFIFDFSWSLWSRTESVVMLAHHIVSISGFVLVLCTGMYGAEIVATLGGSEVTNPLLQARWFLKKTGGYEGRIELVLDWSFMVLFGGVRIGLGGPLTYYFQTNSNVIIPAKVGSAAMFGISVIFFVQIASFVFRKYLTKGRRKSE